MGPRPWKPDAELDGALERGDLRYAVTLATEVAQDRHRPIDLDTALRFLPLIARESPREYDAWALRWLARGAGETPAATIEQAAEVAAALADLPSEPTALDAIRQADRPTATRARLPIEMAEQDKGDKPKGIKTKPENRLRESARPRPPARPKQAPRKPPPAKRNQSGKR